MATATVTSCVRALPVGDPGEPQRAERDDLLALARQPWTMHIGRTPIVVRRATVRDLRGVGQMHRRCSARSLLDRYRQGGRPPTPAALDAELRNPTGFVAVTADGGVVATASVRRDPGHSYVCAEAAVLVEDGWQRRGIGSELLSHLAGVAQVAGFTELIAYPGTAIPAAQRLMVEVGRTRMVPDVNAHLHTYLPEAATLGLGSVRQRLAG
ncbi:Acetyltransferase (GNAT) family protein [Jatrophihabitans endophyticus]|uniref:Acetyltransferase (GNAT) family protein n=1 Tax=Jatrophihabitans endophyticus TaxID=1206085 RepID=A0A1M5QV17_9ACTN|nr:GNAT family N-acetyltransferase [Jatrophihabitans endophyticus]SHH17965.1 Acetyltransferase (GNAT) family protein [Jatrophihabitans endophyticus]